MTANSYPDVRMIRFSNKRNFQGFGACETTDKDIVANGISLRRYAKWSDQNHFTLVDHCRNDILPYVTTVFPEMNMNMMNVAPKNCTYFWPHYYMNGFGGPHCKHRDATGRYSEILTNRFRSGDVNISNLRSADLNEMRKSGVNITELQEQAKKLENMTATK